MQTHGHSFVRIAAALGLVLVLAGCTKGGQFDPTEMFNSDVFDSKKKLQGQREPLFPNGVPGTTTGVPQDLVKGYQPPPDQAADNGDAAIAPPPATAEAAKPPAKPKPKPKTAKAPAHPPTRITVGPAQKPAQSTASTSQFAWPTPSQAGQAQTGQSVWPAPPQASTQQAAQPAQSVWPNPPAAATSTQ